MLDPAKRDLPRRQYKAPNIDLEQLPSVKKMSTAEVLAELKDGQVAIARGGKATKHSGEDTLPVDITMDDEILVDMASGFGKCERTIGRGKFGAELAQYLRDKAALTPVTAGRGRIIRFS